jgi:hypothetical protein
MGAIYAAVLASNLVNRNKTWVEAVEELENFWIDQKNGLSFKAEFTIWSILYYSIYFKAWI